MQARHERGLEPSPKRAGWSGGTSPSVCCFLTALCGLTHDVGGLWAAMTRATALQASGFSATRRRRSAAAPLPVECAAAQMPHTLRLLANPRYNDSIPAELGACIPARGAAGEGALAVLVGNSRALWEPFLDACATEDLLDSDNPLDLYLQRAVCGSLESAAPG